MENQNTSQQTWFKDFGKLIDVMIVIILLVICDLVMKIFSLPITKL